MDFALILRLVGLAVQYGPRISAAISTGRTVMSVVNQAAPDLVPHLEAAASALLSKFAPGTGHADATEFIATSLFAPGRMSPDAERRWFDAQNDQS